MSYAFLYTTSNNQDTVDSNNKVDGDADIEVDGNNQDTVDSNNKVDGNADIEVDSNNQDTVDSNNEDDNIKYDDSNNQDNHNDIIDFFVLIYS